MCRATTARTTGTGGPVAATPQVPTEREGRLPAWQRVLGRPRRLFADRPGGVAVDPSTPLSGFAWAGHETRHLVGTARRPFTLARALAEAFAERVLALGHRTVADRVTARGPTAHLAFDHADGPDVLATVTPVSLDGPLASLDGVDGYVVGVGGSCRALVAARSAGEKQ